MAARGKLDFAKAAATHLVRNMAADDVDLVVLHRTAPKIREPIALDGTTVWKPFVFVARDLLWTRQAGMVPDAPIRSDLVRAQAQTLAAALGRPIFQDDEIIVFRRP